MKSYNCKTCGANIIVNDNTQTFTKCLYCGNNIAFSSDDIANLNIKKIIPFSIDKEDAIARFKRKNNKRIVEAKKVYVPVRFCKFKFNYVYSFCYKDTESSEHDYRIIDHLLDVSAENEIVFGDSKVNNLTSLYEIKEQKRLDYDPVIVDDVSIEIANFDSKKIKNELDSIICDYISERYSGYKIVSVYENNYYVSSIDLEDYSTLIPVYVLKSDDGYIYEVPGVIGSNDDKLYEERLRNKYKDFILHLIPVVAYLLLLLYQILGYSVNQNVVISLLCMGFPFAILFLVIAIKILFIKEKEGSNRFNNYKCEVYSKDIVSYSRLQIK